MREVLEQTRYTRSRQSYDWGALNGGLLPPVPWSRIIGEFIAGVILAAGFVMAFL